MSDLISRQAVLDALDLLDKDWRNVMAYKVEKIPSAEQKKGKWINEPYEKGLYVHRCSNCLKASGIGGGDLWFNFCPNCGADMRGEEDEVD